MIIETKFGKFELIKDVRDAFLRDKFEERYLEEFFNKYEYIVGDVSSEILRLKGFDANPNSPKSFKLIPDYLNESCAYNCPYYILKRIKEKKEIDFKEQENGKDNKTNQGNN